MFESFSGGHGGFMCGILCVVFLCNVFKLLTQGRGQGEDGRRLQVGRGGGRGGRGVRGGGGVLGE